MVVSPLLWVADLYYLQVRTINFDTQNMQILAYIVQQVKELFIVTGHGVASTPRGMVQMVIISLTLSKTTVHTCYLYVSKLDHQYSGN